MGSWKGAGLLPWSPLALWAEVMLPPWEGIWHRPMASPKAPASQSVISTSARMDKAKRVSITLLSVVYCLLKPQTSSSRATWLCLGLCPPPQSSRVKEDLSAPDPGMAGLLLGRCALWVP